MPPTTPPILPPPHPGDAHAGTPHSHVLSDAEMDDAGWIVLCYLLLGAWFIWTSRRGAAARRRDRARRKRRRVR